MAGRAVLQLIGIQPFYSVAQTLELAFAPTPGSTRLSDIRTREKDLLFKTRGEEEDKKTGWQ